MQENKNVLRKSVAEWHKVVHTRCQNRSGQTHARYAANKEEISSDGSRERIYSVNNKTFKTPMYQIKVVLNNEQLLNKLR